VGGVPPAAEVRMAVVVSLTARPEGRAALIAAATESRRRDTEMIVVVCTRDGSADTDPELADAAIAAQVGTQTSWSTHRIPNSEDPAEDIITLAEEVAADLIVMGLKQRSPVGKLILGSGAQRILLDSSCAVLAVKAGDER
jgi:nucleotide-binding universal stress UspA family protein